MRFCKIYLFPQSIDKTVDNLKFYDKCLATNAILLRFEKKSNIF